MEMYRVLKETGPTIIETAIFLLMTLLTTLKDNAYQMASTAAELIANFLNGIADKIGDIVMAAVNLIISFIEGLADAIENEGPRLRKALKKLVTAIVDFFKGVGKDWLQIGKNIVKGIWNGIVELKDWRRCWARINRRSCWDIPSAVGSRCRWLGAGPPGWRHRHQH